jgi:NadR type nicotinamide-nucleotide adenylyltransferase
LIAYALECCENVVLISYSKPEFPRCDPGARERWLGEVFPGTPHLVVTDERLHAWLPDHRRDRQVPRNDAPDHEQRAFVGFLLQEVLNITIDAVFTSEAYGAGFAVALTECFRQTAPSAPAVAHVLFDQARGKIPVSGTAIRSDPHRHREWLSPAVYAAFVERVCILGGESSGKSTLAEALAARLGTVHVAEFGRELWEKQGGTLNFEDMLRIGREQVEREEEAARRANRWLFCDTSPLTTLFYSRHMFGRADPALERLAERRYDHVILCAPDFEFVQDGTRQPPAFRIAQHEWYLDELRRREIQFLTATGSLQDRIDQVSALLEER